MNGSQCFDCLQLNHDLAFNQEVQPVAAVELNFFVHDGNRFLALKLETTQAQLASQAFFIGGLEKARAKNSVYLNGGADDGVGEFVVSHDSPQRHREHRDKQSQSRGRRRRVAHETVLLCDLCVSVVSCSSNGDFFVGAEDVAGGVADFAQGGVGAH